MTEQQPTTTKPADEQDQPDSAGTPESPTPETPPAAAVAATDAATAQAVGVDWVRLPLVVLAVGAGGLIAGWLASVAAQQWLYLPLAYPLLIGLAVGGCAMLGTFLARLGNLSVAALCVLLGAAVSLTTMHYANFQQAIEHEQTELASLPVEMREPLLQTMSFVEYLEWLAEEGFTLYSGHIGEEEGLQFSGPGVWAYWLAELMLVFGIALLLARSQTRRFAGKTLG